MFNSSPRTGWSWLGQPSVFACTVKPRIVSYCVVISTDFYHAPVRLLMRSIASISVSVCLYRSCSNFWKLWLKNFIFGMQVQSYILKISRLSSYAKVIESRSRSQEQIYTRVTKDTHSRVVLLWWNDKLVLSRWKLRHCVVWDAPFILSPYFLFYFQTKNLRLLLLTGNKCDWLETLTQCAE